MAMTPDDLKALHVALEQARDARQACQVAAEALSVAEAKLDTQRVTVGVPCAYCPGTVLKVVTVGSLTVPLQDVCSECRADPSHH